jgi:hypothetical protein
MTRRQRHYEPQDFGCVRVTDPWRTLIAYIDCTNGGAQRAFEDLCRDFERAGWRLENRMFDWRYIRRGLVRWEVAIGPSPASVANEDRRGFMSLIAEHYRKLEGDGRKHD